MAQEISGHPKRAKMCQRHVRLFHLAVARTCATCHMPHAPCPMPHKGRTQTLQEINTHRIQFDLGGSVFNKLVVYFQAGELTFIEWENKSFTISKCIGIDKLWKFTQQAAEGVAETSNFIIIGQH